MLSKNDLIDGTIEVGVIDLSQETRQTQEMYGLDDARTADFGRKGLIERGVRFIQLYSGGGQIEDTWDGHTNCISNHTIHAGETDQPIGALMLDLKQRGLWDETLLAWGGEFGRALRISRGDGRDHWPEAGAAVLAGGGFNVGQVIGETDSHGGRSKGTPYTPSNVLATLYRHLGIDPATTILDHSKWPMHVLDDRESIREL